MTRLLALQAIQKLAYRLFHTSCIRPDKKLFVLWARSSTKAEPSLLPSNTRASSRWKAQAFYTGATFQVRIPPRHRCCPDH